MRRRLSAFRRCFSFDGQPVVIRWMQFVIVYRSLRLVTMMRIEAGFRAPAPRVLHALQFASLAFSKATPPL
ncbi:MAG: hypothetical protein QOJ99_356 [Bryobacterales bacterium]|jgi:hypothetical protein|nr:hypothetical protein [Bryobacterales bacterium]